MRRAWKRGYVLRMLMFYGCFTCKFRMISSTKNVPKGKGGEGILSNAAKQVYHRCLRAWHNLNFVVCIHNYVYWPIFHTVQ